MSRGRRLAVVVAVGGALVATGVPAVAAHEVDHGWVDGGVGSEEEARAYPCPVTEAGGWERVGPVVCLDKRTEAWDLDAETRRGCSYYPQTGWQGDCVFDLDMGSYIKVWGTRGAVSVAFTVTWLHAGPTPSPTADPEPTDPSPSPTTPATSPSGPAGSAGPSDPASPSPAPSGPAPVGPSPSPSSGVPSADPAGGGGTPSPPGEGTAAPDAADGGTPLAGEEVPTPAGGAHVAIQEDRAGASTGSGDVRAILLLLATAVAAGAAVWIRTRTTRA